MATKQKKGLATIRQAADYLALSTRTIYRMIEEGELKVVYVRSSPRVRWSQLERLIEPKKPHKKTPTPAAENLE